MFSASAAARSLHVPSNAVSATGNAGFGPLAKGRFDSLRGARSRPSDVAKWHPAVRLRPLFQPDRLRLRSPAEFHAKNTPGGVLPPPLGRLPSLRPHATLPAYI